MKKRFIKENLEDIIKLILACIFLVVLLVINEANETSKENDQNKLDETVEFDGDSYSEIED